MDIKFVPGIPVRKYNVCVSPDQQPIPHIIKSYSVIDGGLIDNGYEPNNEYYYDYEYLIRDFIKSIVVM